MLCFDKLTMTQAAQHNNRSVSLSLSKAGFDKLNLTMLLDKNANRFFQ